MYRYYVSCKKWQFYLLFFQFGFLLFILIWLLWLWLSNIMLNKSGETGHPCLVPDFRWNISSFSPLNIMQAVVLNIWSLLCWNASLYSHFLVNFYHKWMLNLSKSLSSSIETIIWLLIFRFSMWYIKGIDLQILEILFLDAAKLIFILLIVFCCCNRNHYIIQEQKIQLYIF